MWQSKKKVVIENLKISFFFVDDEVVWPDFMRRILKKLVLSFLTLMKLIFSLEMNETFMRKVYDAMAWNVRDSLLICWTKNSFSPSNSLVLVYVRPQQEARTQKNRVFFFYYFRCEIIWASSTQLTFLWTRSLRLWVSSLILVQFSVHIEPEENKKVFFFVRLQLSTFLSQFCGWSDIISRE